MSKRRVLALAMGAACALGTWAADAKVASADKSGFLLEQEYDIAAPPAKLFADLVRVGKWWSSDHSYSGDARNMSIEARAGGCFCEKVAEGSVEHLRVVFAAPGKALRLSGGLGPLQSMGSGLLEFSIEPAGAFSKLKVTYRVWGYDPAGLDAIAPKVDGVIAEQVRRLQSFAETGKPTP